jgi:hypothetical protein
MVEEAPVSATATTAAAVATTNTAADATTADMFKKLDEVIPS